MAQAATSKKYHILVFIEMVHNQNENIDSLSNQINMMDLNLDDIKSRQGAPQNNINIIFKANCSNGNHTYNSCGYF